MTTDELLKSIARKIEELPIAATVSVDYAPSFEREDLEETPAIGVLPTEGELRSQVRSASVSSRSFTAQAVIVTHCIASDKDRTRDLVGMVGTLAASLCGELLNDEENAPLGLKIIATRPSPFYDLERLRDSGVFVGAVEIEVIG